MSVADTFRFDHTSYKMAAELRPEHFSDFMRLVKSVRYGNRSQVLVAEFDEGAYRDALMSRIDVVATEARLTGRTLDVRLPADGVLLAGRFDLSLSLRIVTNLIDNADKYSPVDQPITVEAERNGGLLHIRVLDRGPGVPAAESERIFEPFYRPLAAASDPGSAGLGLAICRRMAELQHGSLSYAAHPGGGSVFTLTLQAVALPAPEDESAPL